MLPKDREKVRECMLPTVRTEKSLENASQRQTKSWEETERKHSAKESHTVGRQKVRHL